MNRLMRCLMGINLALVAVLGTVLPVHHTFAATTHLPSMTSTRSEAAGQYAHLPISFEVNRGQTDHRVRFLAHGPGYTLFLTPTEAVFGMRAPVQSAAATPAHQGDVPWSSPSLAPRRPAPPARIRQTALAFRFLHANSHPQIVGLDPLPGRVNYFIGNDPHQWHTNIRTYARVEYRNLYPGIDLVYYGHLGHLEYDWLIHPHANVNRIDLAVVGATHLQLSRTGTLLIHTALGSLTGGTPSAWQSGRQGRVMIQSRYEVHRGNQVRIQVARMRHDVSLDLDPSLIYSTYLGGSDQDYAAATALDSSGDVYVAGLTDSTNFPIQNPYQPTYSGSGDAFVTKFSPSGSSVIYSTYLGGAYYDQAYGIAVDGAGDAYVAGLTYSSDFPIVNAFQAVCLSCANNLTSAFVTKLAPSGSSLIYSTYLGGSAENYANAITVDSAGDAYVAGLTESADFPIKNGFQAFLSGPANAFVTKFAPSGSSLVYSTYLGGSAYDYANAIAIDSAGDAYVAGAAGSTNFPTLHPFQAALSGPEDGFVTKFAPSGSSLLYSTYLGGSAGDYAFGIAVDGRGEAYVAGSTYSPDFPIQRAYQPTYGGGYLDAFLTKFAPSGSALIYSTYLGGSGKDAANAVAIDSAGDAYVAGQTASTDFPTQNPNQAANAGFYDAFVTKFAPSGGDLLFSTYLGGSGEDYAYGIAVNGANHAYVAGGTLSKNFPTKNAFQPIYGGGSEDAFVAAVSVGGPWLSVHPNSGAPGSQAQVSGTGFGADESVKVAFCATSACESFTILGTGTTDANGNFGGTSPEPAVTITIPSMAVKGKTYTIGAEGTASKAVAKTQFTVT